jgi:hypothetical protein
VGEFSIPLDSEAKDTASFELEDEVKGVFLETYFKKGLSSLGGHTFIDDDRWLLTGVGGLNIEEWYATLGVGYDNVDGRESRVRYSAELEYLPQLWEHTRPGAGVRVEEVTDSGQDSAFIPYVIIGSPNHYLFSFFIQAEYRVQKNNELFLIDLSGVF